MNSPSGMNDRFVDSPLPNMNTFDIASGAPFGVPRLNVDSTSSFPVAIIERSTPAPASVYGIFCAIPAPPMSS